MPSKMEVAPQCIQKLKVGRKMVWIWKLSSFLVFGNFSKIFKKFWILENSREISLLDLDLEAFSFHFSLLEKSESDFYFTFHFSKRVNQIFISLFTSRKEWNRFSFHFSLLELSISTLAGHWSSQPYSHHNKHSLVIAFVVKNCHHSLIWAMVSYQQKPLKWYFIQWYTDRNNWPFNLAEKFKKSCSDIIS